MHILNIIICTNESCLSVNLSRIALSYVKQTFNVQLYQEIVTRMTEAWLVIYISVDILHNFIKILTF